MLGTCRRLDRFTHWTCLVSSTIADCCALWRRLSSCRATSQEAEAYEHYRRARSQRPLESAWRQLHRHLIWLAPHPDTCTLTHIRVRVDFLRKQCCVHRPGQSRLSAQLALSVIACICNSCNGGRAAIKNRFATYKCCPEQEWARECGTCLKNKTTNQQAVEFAPAPPPSVAVSGDNLPLAANSFFAMRFFCCILRSCGT